MSGLIGHSMYGILAEKAAQGLGLPVAGLIARQRSSFLCGAYLGCDVVTLPEAVCSDTGREFGYGTVPVEKSPFTGGAIRPWKLQHGGISLTPRELHGLFYGRAHLVFGWPKDQAMLRIPWDHLADYGARAIEDCLQDEAQVAYTLGSMVHIVGDSLIKSVQPGLHMNLLGGLYTPRNRIVQDQFTFHRIGPELGVDWPTLFAQMAANPVMDSQLHFMRVGEARGRLAELFSEGWLPQPQGLLREVLRQNRRWLSVHAQDVLAVVALDKGRASAQALRANGGIAHADMLEIAERAGMRRTLVQIAEEAAALMERIVNQVPVWANASRRPDPAWAQLRKRWNLS